MSQKPMKKPIILSATKARSGVIVQGMRFVLAASLALAVIAMAWTYLASPDQPAAPAMAKTAPG